LCEIFLILRILPDIITVQRSWSSCKVPVTLRKTVK